MKKQKVMAYCQRKEEEEDQAAAKLWKEDKKAAQLAFDRARAYEQITTTIKSYGSNDGIKGFIVHLENEVDWGTNIARRTKKEGWEEWRAPLYVALDVIDFVFSNVQKMKLRKSVRQKFVAMGVCGWKKRTPQEWKIMGEDPPPPLATKEADEQ